MKTACIMQPTYLPWAGYFNLICRCDVFVFLDDVQFCPRSWQQRNRIVLGGQPHWLTVPVRGAGRGRQQIRQVETAEEEDWRRKHLDTLHHAYSKCAGCKPVVSLVAETLAQPQTGLACVNISLIRAFCRALAIEREFCLSSDLPESGHRSAYLLEICRHFGADTYLSAAGSREYIEQEGVLPSSEVKVLFQDFVPPPYPQKGVTEFIPFMSVVDLAANVGFERASQYVRGGC